MAVWNALNFKPGRLVPDPSNSAEWNRGRYLVDALGHCGACHTPKNWLGADDRFGLPPRHALQGWHAPNITANDRQGIGRWSIEDIITYLKSGVNSNVAGLCGR